MKLEGAFGETYLLMRQYTDFHFTRNISEVMTTEDKIRHKKISLRSSFDCQLNIVHPLKQPHFYKFRYTGFPSTMLHLFLPGVVLIAPAAVTVLVTSLLCQSFYPFTQTSCQTDWLQVWL